MVQWLKGKGFQRAKVADATAGAPWGVHPSAAHPALVAWRYSEIASKNAKSSISKQD